MYPTRRELLQRAGCGFGSLALAAMLAEDGLLADEKSVDPLAPKKPPHEAKAKRVIFLFMSGGPSQVDTFDPKPELTRLHGQKLPESFGPVKTRRGVDKNKLLASKRTFQKYGKSGIEVRLEILERLLTKYFPQVFSNYLFGLETKPVSVSSVDELILVVRVDIRDQPGHRVGDRADTVFRLTPLRFAFEQRSIRVLITKLPGDQVGEQV